MQLILQIWNDTWRDCDWTEGRYKIHRRMSEMRTQKCPAVKADIDGFRDKAHRTYTGIVDDTAGISKLQTCMYLGLKVPCTLQIEAM